MSQETLSPDNPCRVLFVHGGPGLNSNPERHLIPDNILNNALWSFWDEPEELPQKNPYQFVLRNLVETIEQIKEPLFILAHSSGCRLVLDILPSVEKKLLGLFFSAPVVDLHYSDEATIQLGLSTLRNNQDQNADRLASLSNGLGKAFDKTKGDAIALAFSSGFYKNYFASEESFENYYHYFADEFDFKLHHYLSLRRNIPELSQPKKPFSIPCTAFYGESDPVVDSAYQSEVLSKFVSPLQTMKISGVSHYPHIDKQASVFNQVNEQIQLFH